MRRGTPAEGDPLRWAPGIPLRASSPQWRCPCVAGLGGRGRDVRPAAADRGAAAQCRRRAARARRGADLGPVGSADPAALPRPGPGPRGERPRHPLRRRRPHPGSRLLRAHPHPRRGRADHAMVEHPGRRGAGRGAVDGGGGRLRRHRRVRRPSDCSTCRGRWRCSIGAVLASTDAAAVFSVLRQVPLPRRLSGMLEAESGFNDATGDHPYLGLVAVQLDAEPASPSTGGSSPCRPCSS